MTATSLTNTAVATRGRRKLQRVELRKLLRIEVVERDGAYCRYCGDGPFEPYYSYDWKFRLAFYMGGAEIDHIVPVALGGTNEPDNLVVCCTRCNASKGRGLKALPLRAPAPISVLQRSRFPYEPQRWS